jgi:CelD/BcsL family acetyltransferase involved in cellulose biosynthesis
VAASVDEAHHIFDEMVALHQRRWNSEGQPGCYASRVFSAFHRELIDRLTDSGRLLLMRVRAGDETLGCTQLLIDRGRALNYQGGRQIGETRLSPGLITDYCGMVECLQRGYSAYDFMAGDSMHKRRLSTDASPLVWLRWRRPRLKYAVMHALRDCRRRVQSLRDSWRTRSGSAANVPARNGEGGGPA